MGKCGGNQTELIIIVVKISRTIQAMEARYSMLVTAIQLLFCLCVRASAPGACMISNSKIKWKH